MLIFFNQLKKKILFSIVFLQLVALSAFAQFVTIKGEVKNISDSVLTFVRLKANTITGEMNGKRFETSVDRTGKFEIKLPEPDMAEWGMEYNKSMKQLLLTTNNDIFLEIDQNAKDSLVNDGVVAKGKNANDINYFRLYFSSLLEYDKSGKSREGLSSFLLDNVKKADLSQNYKKWYSTNFKYGGGLLKLILLQNKPDANTDQLADSLLKYQFNDDYAAANFSVYGSLLMLCIDRHVPRTAVSSDLENRISFAANHLKGLTRQLGVAKLLSEIRDDENYDHYYKIYGSIIKNQHLKNELSELLAKGSGSENENFGGYPELEALFSQYKGKIVYVDFWASWCGPCRAEMPNSKKLAKRFEGKNIVFVYLGYKDRKEDWLAAQKEDSVGGEQYLLNAAQVKQVNRFFEITGVPHYAIINENGEVISKDANRPSRVYDQLTKLFDKL